jgi:hypothetical protein
LHPTWRDYFRSVGETGDVDISIRNVGGRIEKPMFHFTAGMGKKYMK